MDTAPNAAGTPDVDGFVVNHAPASLAGIQTNPFVADSVGEFIGVVWETATAPGADTHIRGQFYDVIGAFDAFIPNAINISDGIGIETNPVIVSGGANSGWGAAWEQRDNAADTLAGDSHQFRRPRAADRARAVGRERRRPRRPARHRAFRFLPRPHARQPGRWIGAAKGDERGLQRGVGLDPP